MDNHFKISVIICTYNEELCILQALKSLKANKIYKETEVILIDDCSTNGITIRILTLLERLTNSRVIRSEKNYGLSNSRNLGFENARTEFILPLDADDTFPPGTIDVVYQTFQNNNKIDFIVGNYNLHHLDTKKSEVIYCRSIAVNNFISAKQLSADWKLLGTSPCKKSTWKKVGGYNLTYSFSVQDVDFWIRVIQNGNIGYYLDTIIYNWNKSPLGMNMNFDRRDMIKLLNEHEEFYLLNFSKKQLYNKIFEGYYPYKEAQIINGLGKSYFNYLSSINKLRFIYFTATNWIVNLQNNIHISNGNHC